MVGARLIRRVLWSRAAIRKRRRYGPGASGDGGLAGVASAGAQAAKPPRSRRFSSHLHDGASTRSPASTAMSAAGHGIPLATVPSPNAEHRHAHARAGLVRRRRLSPLERRVTARCAVVAGARRARPSQRPPGSSPAEQVKLTWRRDRRPEPPSIGIGADVDLVAERGGGSAVIRDGVLVGPRRSIFSEITARREGFSR